MGLEYRNGKPRYYLLSAGRVLNIFEFPAGLRADLHSIRRV